MKSKEFELDENSITNLHFIRTSEFDYSPDIYDYKIKLQDSTELSLRNLLVEYSIKNIGVLDLVDFKDSINILNLLTNRYLIKPIFIIVDANLKKKSDL